MILAALCLVVAVHDGDTFACADGRRVRLAVVDANEIDGSCHRDCAPMPAAGARDRLAARILGRRVRLDQVGVSYGRAVAFVSDHGVDLSCWQLRAGAAAYEPRFDYHHRLARRCRGRVDATPR